MTLKNQAIQTALDGNWQNAISINKSLIQEDPHDIDALNRLALAYSVTGKLKEAKTTYQKVINIDSLNPIALRNLKRLKENGVPSGNGNSGAHINNRFLEEPGKTKVIELVNIAQPKIVEGLRTGQTIQLSVKRLKIFVSEGRQYVGVLPDDIARRLTKFINAGCIYDAYIKSANQHKVTVFIKEIKKTSKFKDQPSFTSLSESPLTFAKTAKPKIQSEEQINKNDNEEEENYSEEE